MEPARVVAIGIGFVCLVILVQTIGRPGRLSDLNGEIAGEDQDRVSITAIGALKANRAPAKGFDPVTCRALWDFDTKEKLSSEQNEFSWFCEQHGGVVEVDEKGESVAQSCRCGKGLFSNPWHEKCERAEIVRCERSVVMSPA